MSKPQINLKELPTEEKKIIFNAMFFGTLFGLFIGFSTSIIVIKFAVYQVSKYITCMPL